MIRYFTYFLIWASILACGRKVLPLRQPFPSLQALAEFHLRCIEANDRSCFESRLITKQEFRDSVFPFLPESKTSSGNLAIEDYWAWTIPDQRKAIKRVFERFGGAKLLKFTLGDPKKVMNLDGMKLHRDIPIYADFQNPQTKSAHALITTDLFKAIVEVNGGHKLWNMTYE